jgi:molybdate transport repressor ModE-like protein
MMTIRQMTIFAAVARHGSFRSCAEQLGISQAVVSAHIRELESDLGAPLFERKAGMAAVLTEKGQHALHRISGILADIHDLRSAFTSDRTRRTISVCTYGFIMLRVQDRLDAFRLEFQDHDLTISLRPPGNRALIAQVQRGDVDLACFFTLDPGEEPESQRVGQEELAIYVGDDHPLRQHARVTGAMLSAYPTIVLCQENPQRLLTEKALAAIGASPNTIMLETDALGLMLHNVRRHQGWICLFSRSVDESVPGLNRLDLAQPLPAADICLYSRPSSRHDPVLGALRSCFSFEP